METRGLAEEQAKAEQTVSDLLEMLEVAQFADQLPADLGTGTKRAVAIARALAEDPDAILYDEPTTMVDPLMAAHVSDLIAQTEKAIPQDFDRGDARHASGQETGRPRDFSARKGASRFSARGRSWRIRRILSCGIFLRRTN